MGPETLRLTSTLHPGFENDIQDGSDLVGVVERDGPLVHRVGSAEEDYLPELTTTRPSMPG